MFLNTVTPPAPTVYSKKTHGGLQRPALGLESTPAPGAKSQGARQSQRHEPGQAD